MAKEQASPSLDVAKKLLAMTGPQTSTTTTTSGNIWDKLAQLAMMSFFMMPDKTGGGIAGMGTSGLSATPEGLASAGGILPFGGQLGGGNYKSLTPADLEGILQMLLFSGGGGIL